MGKAPFCLDVEGLRGENTVWVGASAVVGVRVVSRAPGIAPPRPKAPGAAARPARRPGPALAGGTADGPATLRRGYPGGQPDTRFTRAALRGTASAGALLLLREKRLPPSPLPASRALLYLLPAARPNAAAGLGAARWGLERPSRRPRYPPGLARPGPAPGAALGRGPARRQRRLR